MKPIQFILLAALAAAIAVTAARFKRGEIRGGGAIFWTLVWLLGGAFTLAPEYATRLAAMVGVGRGADLVMYVSIVFLLWAVFRLLVRTERQRREMTELVRRIALKEREASSTKRDEDA